MNALQEQFLFKKLADDGYSVGFMNQIPSDISIEWFNENSVFLGKSLTFTEFFKLYIDAIEEANKYIYIEKRINEYPSIENQLDMIYWDMINGTSNWKDTITEIKNKYPKS